MSEVGWVDKLSRLIFGKREESLVGLGGERRIQLTLFIPSVDRDSKPIDQVLWRRGALEWLGQAFGGGTAFPPGHGVWRDDGRNGRLVFDETIVIFSYVAEAVLRANKDSLRQFMTNMG